MARGSAPKRSSSVYTTPARRGPILVVCLWGITLGRESFWGCELTGRASLGAVTHQLRNADESPHPPQLLLFA
eukprot:643851-Amphidinium_carterae.5